MPRPDRLSNALVDTLTERGPSPATVELHALVLAWVRRVRGEGLSAGRAISILREVSRGTLEPLASTFALQRCVHTIIGDVTRWCLNEYFRAQRDSPTPSPAAVGGSVEY